MWLDFVDHLAEIAGCAQPSGGLAYAARAIEKDNSEVAGTPQELASQLAENLRNAEAVLRKYAASTSPTAGADAAEALWHLSRKGKPVGRSQALERSDATKG